MSETPRKKQDFVEVAKHQLAQITAEIEKALEALKDPQRRQELTSSSLDALQKGLSRAQDSVARYQARVAKNPPTAAPQDGSTSDSSPAAEPMAARPESPPEPPTS